MKAALTETVNGYSAEQPRHCAVCNKNLINRNGCLRMIRSCWIGIGKMRRSLPFGLFVICLLILGVSSVVLLKRTGSPGPATQAQSLPLKNALNQDQISLGNLKRLKVEAVPGAAQPTPAQQSQEQQQIAQLQADIESLQAQLAKSQNTQADDTLTEVIAAVGAIGGLIGSIATLITALKGPAKA